MKKLAGIVLFLLVAASIFAEDDVGDWVNECISLLGKPVPKEFERAGRYTYQKVKNDITIGVVVENNLIYKTVCGVFYTTSTSKSKASAFTGEFYDYFEKTNWQYFDTLYDRDVYKKDGVYAIISIGKGDDGEIYEYGLIEFVNNIVIDYLYRFFR
jgi:hypothetical protein